MPLYEPEEEQKVGGRDYAEQQNAGVPNAPQGALAQAKSKIAGKIPTSTDDVIKLGTEKALGKYAESNTGKAVVSLAQDVKNVAKIWAGDLTGIWPLVQKHWKVISVILLIPGLMIVGMGAAIGASLSHIGDLGGAVAAPANGILTGGYCAGMQPTLDWKTKSGAVEHLSLFATDGQYSSELSYEDETKSGGAPSLDSYRSQDSSSQNYFPDSWKPYYASARMGYTASAFAHGPLTPGEAKKYFDGLPTARSYASRRLIFYNPANGKAAVALASDWGPNSGVFKTRTTEFIDSQKKLWEGEGSKNGYRITNPTNDSEALIGGGGPTLSAELGASQYTQIKMGFATDQTLDPSKPFTCNVVSTTGANSSNSPTTVSGTDVSNDSAKDNDGPTHFIQNVPAVRQRDGHDCNKAATAMVILHYEQSATGYTSTNAKGQLVNDEDSCTRAELISTLKSQGVTFKTLQKSEVTAELIKKSIDVGDPVIISQHGLISGDGHFVVVVGYDNSKFYVNDPFPWGVVTDDTTLGTVHVYTNKGHTPTHNDITQTALISALYGGNTGGGYVAIVRQR